jgi:carboxyl-terminal processing protease
MDKGTIVTVRGGNGKEQVFKADGKSLLGDMPILLLVNEQTASAAEIMAGALRDNDRAKLLGTRTYGKGSVQQIIDLDKGEKGALKLTTAHYYRPNGRSLQKRPGAKTWGVDPDDGFFTPLDAKQMERWRDKALERDVVGARDRPAPKKLTPAVIAEDYADPQLGAALRSMLARLKDGRFEKVGKPAADLVKHFSRGEELRRRREELMKDLERVNKELSDLDKPRKEKP